MNFVLHHQSSKSHNFSGFWFSCGSSRFWRNRLFPTLIFLEAGQWVDSMGGFFIFLVAGNLIWFSEWFVMQCQHVICHQDTMETLYIYLLFFRNYQHYLFVACLSHCASRSEAFDSQSFRPGFAPQFWRDWYATMMISCRDETASVIFNSKVDVDISRLIIRIIISLESNVSRFGQLGFFSGWDWLPWFRWNQSVNSTRTVSGHWTEVENWEYYKVFSVILMCHENSDTSFLSVTNN